MWVSVSLFTRGDRPEPDRALAGPAPGQSRSCRGPGSSDRSQTQAPTASNIAEQSCSESED